MKALLLRAHALLVAKRYAEAREVLAEARALASRADGRIWMVLSSLAFVARDHQRSLDDLAEAVRRTPDAKQHDRLWRLQMGAAGAVGWDHEQRRIIEGALEHRAEDPHWLASAAHLHAKARNWETAAQYARRCAAKVPDSPRMLMELGSLLAHCVPASRGGVMDETGAAMLDEAKTSVDRALELVNANENPRPQVWAYLREAAHVFRDLGLLDRARALDDLSLVVEPDNVRVAEERAELSLWVNDIEAALSGAAGLDTPGSRRIAAAAKVMRGEFELALAELESVVEDDPKDYRAHVWLAEAALRLGKHTRAHDALTASTAVAEDFLAVSWIMRMVLVLDEHEALGNELPKVRPSHTEEYRTLVAEVFDDGLSVLESRDPVAVRNLLNAFLKRLGGNRSTLLTVTEGDAGPSQARRLHSREGCRFVSRRVLQLIRILPGDEVLRRFAPIVEEFPGSTLPLCHQGELRFWLGDLEGARRDLERCVELDAGTRWAWIGLAGIDICEGNLEASLETQARGIKAKGNTEGPAVYVYRGEALRRLGRVKEALEDLERSVAVHYTRLGARINLALARQADGNHEGFQELWRGLLLDARGLLSDAGDAIGQSAWADDDQFSTDTAVAVLEAALEACGGNRSSSCQTYFTKDGELRGVPSPSARGRESLEQRDRDLMTQVARTLRI